MKYLAQHIPMAFLSFVFENKLYKCICKTTLIAC